MKADGLSDKPHLDNFVVSLQFNRVWFVDCHQCWAHNCDFEMGMPTNNRLTKTFVGWHNAEMIAFLPGICTQRCIRRYATDWLDGSREAYCWCGRRAFQHITSARRSESYKTHLWRIAITESLVFLLISFVVAAREGLLMSKNADPPMVSEVLGMLVPMNKHLAS